VISNVTPEERKKRHKWSLPANWPKPAVAAPAGQASSSAAAADAAGRSPPAQRDGTYFVGKLFVYAIFFGFIGGLSMSSFPVGLGIFLFFTDDDLLEWALRKAGIRLLPDSLGAHFIKAFVFLTVTWTLLAYWRASAPAWLSTWIPPYASWSLIGATALACALLNVTAAAVTRKLLPRRGIAIARGSLAWTAIEALIGFAVLGLLALVLSIFPITD
jgi:hypothetical protein